MCRYKRQTAYPSLRKLNEGEWGRFFVKDPAHQYADTDGWVECVWHHHQDAKTMLPVPIQTHNRSFPTGSPHTGGASILTKSELQDLIGFFDSPTGI